MLTRGITVALAALLTVAGTASPALAGDGGSSKGPSAPLCGNGGCSISVGTPGRPGSSTGGDRNSGGGGGSGEPSPCTYRPVDPPANAVTAVGGQPSGSGSWYYKVCNSVSGGGAGFQRGELVFLAQPPVVTPEQLARQARSELALPAVTIKANPDGTALVNLPVWLALSGGWEPQSATASVPGLSVTATARPQRVTFAMGDGSNVVCEGPGTVYRPGADDPYASSPDCGYRYRSASIGQPGEAYRVTATVTWTVSWAGGGESGTIAGLTSTGSIALRVAESQAIVTR